MDEEREQHETAGPVLNYYFQEKAPPTWAPAYNGAVAVSGVVHVVLYTTLLFLLDIAAPRLMDTAMRDIAWLSVLYWVLVAAIVIRHRRRPRRVDLLFIAFGLPAVVLPLLALDLAVRWLAG